jgi:hypothetical protein
VHLVRLSSSGTVLDSSTYNATQFGIKQGALARFGAAMASVGDWGWGRNSDESAGQTDLLVGAPGLNGSTGCLFLLPFFDHSFHHLADQGGSDAVSSHHRVFCAHGHGYASTSTSTEGGGGSSSGKANNATSGNTTSGNTTSGSDDDDKDKEGSYEDTTGGQYFHDLGLGSNTSVAGMGLGSSLAHVERGFVLAGAPGYDYSKGSLWALNFTLFKSTSATTTTMAATTTTRNTDDAGGVGGGVGGLDGDRRLVLSRAAERIDTSGLGLVAGDEFGTSVAVLGNGRS